MENFIELICAAAASDASQEARAAGAEACRLILQVLETKKGEPMATGVAAPASPLASVVASLRGTSYDQLLDLAIAKLRSALPPGTKVPEVEPFPINLVRIPDTARQP